jgi:hypothetical protein
MAKAKKRPGTAKKTRLDIIIKKARLLMAGAERDDVRARHAVGVLVENVRTKGGYGDSAVAKMAKALGVGESTLRRYGDVAKAWTAGEASSFINKAGVPLSWSHLELLVGVPDGRTRNSLLKLAREKNLSVRDLRAELLRRGEKVDGGATEKLLTAALDAKGARLAGFAKVLLEEGQKLLANLATLEQVPSDVLEKVEASGARINEAAEALRALAARLGTRVADARQARLPNLKVAATG